MHTLEFPETAGRKGRFHYNSDFSGEVTICTEFAEVPGSFAEVEVPGEAIQALLHTLIESKLSEIDETLAGVILRAITKP